jgi:hypothetical protein
LLTFSGSFFGLQQGFTRVDGEYRCDGLTILGDVGSVQVVGAYDPGSGILTWDGVEFREET